MLDYYLWVFKSTAYKERPIKTIFRAASLAAHIILKRGRIIDTSFGSTSFKFRYVPGARHAGGRGLYIFREHIEQLMQFGDRLLRLGDVVIDCGANQGVFTTAFAKYVGEFGKVIAFEPMDYAIERIRDNLSLNGLENCEIINAAVSDSEGTAKFDLSTGVGSASIVIDHGGKQVIDVKTATIDDTLERLGVDRVDFIKLDVEGAELLAIKGSTKLFSRCRPIICMEISPGDEEGSAHDALLRLGYRPFVFVEARMTLLEKVSAATNVFYFPQARMPEA